MVASAAVFGQAQLSASPGASCTFKQPFDGPVLGHIVVLMPPSPIVLVFTINSGMELTGTLAAEANSR